ncbi:hypothetical protein A9Q81_25925 [Gammaproteobacteria bacterium 42_54_T18]|nr:hypothetical protein A9Q81_25925 [Gammaproteobacteria bacterium 42_54_T18]
MASQCVNVSRSYGQSLVELMIALGLGLGVSAFAIQLYVGHSSTVSLQRSLSLMQEQGRYVQELLSAQLKLSGYAGAQGVVNSFVFSVDSDGVQDVLEIQIAGAGTDCMGGALAVDSVVKHKRFYVKNDVLYCFDSDGIRAPIVQNVDSFQVVYGVDLDESVFFDSGYGSADVYVDGSTLFTEPYANVVSVKVAIVIKSMNIINALQDHEAVDDVWVLNRYVEDRFTTSSDGYLRRLFVNTIALRNFRDYEGSQL